MLIRSSQMGAVSFIETMDHTSLSKITREEFEANVEQAIQELPPSPTPSSPIMPSHFPTHMPSSSSTAPTFSAPTSTHFPLPTSPHIGEESARPLVLPTTPFPNPSTLAEDTKRFLQRTGDLAQRTIGKPLDAIGKIFVEALEEVDENLLRRGGMDPQDGDYPGRSARQDQYDPFRGDGVQDVPQWALRPPPAGVVGRSETSPVAIQTPYRPRIRQAHSREPSGSPMATPGIPTPSRQPSYSQAPPPLQLPALSTSPSFFQQLLTTSGLASERVPSRAATPDLSRARAATPSTPTGTGLDIVAMQNEIDRAHEAANEAARETILQIFPSLDGEVADMILEANNGDLGLSIDKLLEMNLSPSA